MRNSSGTGTRHLSARKPAPPTTRKDKDFTLINCCNWPHKRLRWLIVGILITVLLMLNIVSLRGRRSDPISLVGKLSNNEYLAMPLPALPHGKAVSDDPPRRQETSLQDFEKGSLTMPLIQTSSENSIGSQEHLELASRDTNENASHTNEERQKQRESDKEDENRDPSEEKASIVQLVEAEERNPAIPVLQPAGDKAIRPPISGRPPLHRPASETHIQKIMLTISSFDQGQRISHLWAGDKLQTIQETLVSVREFCERGFDLTVWFIAAWKISQHEKIIEEALFCQRIHKPIHIRYWDHFSPDIRSLLSSRHRLAMAEVIGKTLKEHENEKGRRIQ